MQNEIEQIAKSVCHLDRTCDECMTSFECKAMMYAKRFYNAGYRKASDVAREIERYLRLNEDIAIRCKAENGEQNEEYWKGKLSAFRQIRGFIDAELKKKYESEGVE